MSGNKRLFITIFVSGIAVVLGYVINYFLTYYITENVGIEAYGFVSIAKTTVSYAQILTIALTNFTVRFIAVSYHKKNMVEANEFYSSSILASAVLSSAIFAVALVFIWKLEFLLNIPTELVQPVKILFVIIFINFVVTTMTTPVSAAGVIKNRLDVAGVINIISHIVEFCTLLLLGTVFTPGLWFVGIASLSASLIKFLGNVVLTRVLTPELRFHRKAATINRVKTIVGNGIYSSINSLGNVLNSGLDLIVSNLFLNGVVTGQIAVVKSLATIFSMLTSTIYQPMQPKLIETYSSGDINLFMEELKKGMKICGYFTNVALAGFIALGTLYYQLWLPNQDSVLLYQLTVITVLMYLTDGIMKPVYYVYVLVLKNKIPCFVTIFTGLLNITAMYLLLKFTDLGGFAVVGTTTVIMIANNLTFNVLYAAKCLGISARSFYQVILRHILSAVVMTVLFCALEKLASPSGWVGLIFCALIMCILGCIIHVIIMSSKNEIKKIFNNIMDKIYAKNK